MRFERFPFDTQNCSFFIKSLKRQRNLRWKPADVNHPQSLQNSDFFIFIDASHETEKFVGTRTIPASGFYLVLQRKSGYYIYLYFIPSATMVAASWISFTVSYDAVPGRLGLLLTVLLMLINMNNAIATSIPKADHPCPLTLWVLLSIIFIIFALIEYLIILIGVKFGGGRFKVGNLDKSKEKNEGI